LSFEKNLLLLKKLKEKAEQTLLNNKMEIQFFEEGENSEFFFLIYY